MKKYSFIPYESFSINSNLRLAEVKEKYKEILISTDNDLLIVDDYFEFRLKKNEFKLVRKFLPEYYHNSFLPYIKGNIKESVQGTIIDVEFNIRDSTYAILFFFILIYLLILGTTIRVVLSDSSFFIGLIFILLVGIVLYFIFFISYNMEAIKAKRFLAKYFETER